MPAAAASAESRDVLRIEDVTVTGGDREHADVMHGSLRAHAGDLVLVQVINLEQAEAWGDVAVGLLAPESGRVEVLGNDPAELDLETGNRLRGHIGRVFSRGNWLDRLSLMDNVLLAARHHALAGEEELARQASALAVDFGMPGIPLDAPGRLSRLDLQRAACVRGFLAEPPLLILEDPTYGNPAELLPPLMKAIREARNRGAAVLWLSPSMDIWRARTIPVSRRYRMAGSELMEVGGR